MIVKAYEYTTILSVMLCDAMTIPSVFVLSWIFLHTKFQKRHFVAAILCLVGLALMIVTDAKKSTPGAKQPIIGDIMALSASFLYAISNICQEVLVKSDDWVVFSPLLSQLEGVLGNDGCRRFGG